MKVHGLIMLVAAIFTGSTSLLSSAAASETNASEIPTMLCSESGIVSTPVHITVILPPRNTNVSWSIFSDFSETSLASGRFGTNATVVCTNVLIPIEATHRVALFVDEPPMPKVLVAQDTISISSRSLPKWLETLFIFLAGGIFSHFFQSVAEWQKFYSQTTRARREATTTVINWLAELERDPLGCIEKEPNYRPSWLLNPPDPFWSKELRREPLRCLIDKTITSLTRLKLFRDSGTNVIELSSLKEQFSNGLKMDIENLNGSMDRGYFLKNFWKLGRRNCNR